MLESSLLATYVGRFRVVAFVEGISFLVLLFIAMPIKYVDAFGKTAETIAQYLKKGNPILIEGRLRLHTWDDKQTNQKQSKLRVDLETFKFIGAPNREGGSASAPRPADYIRLER